MIVIPFFVKGLAHSSYLLGGTDTCGIIDPRRDIQIYLDAARSMNMKISHILETHLHADFVSGHMDLADATGAAIHAPASGNCAFEHEAMSEGDTFQIGDMTIKVLETPGHTPEHISYVVSDASRGEEPVSVFCGDTLFVGDVGRPDLFPGKAKELASELYDSLHAKLFKLPDHCEVYPAHGAGSLCGRAMGAKRESTIGYERKYNYAISIKDRAEFIASLTTNMPGAPDHFSRCSNINRLGPARAEDLTVIEAMDPKPFHNMAKQNDTIVLDVRSYGAFGGHHVNGAYSIDMGGNIATFSGWLLPPDKQILLVTENEAQANAAVVWLRRVGLDNVAGYLEGGMFEWATSGLPTQHVPQLSVEELHMLGAGTKEMVVVDVRATSEYEEFHIQNSINIPVADLRTRYSDLDPEAETALICSTGHRSSTGTSILQQHGFENVYNATGGMTGYNQAGYGPECPMCAISWAGFAGRKH